MYIYIYVCVCVYTHAYQWIHMCVFFLLHISKKYAVRPTLNRRAKPSWTSALLGPPKKLKLPRQCKTREA